MPYRQRLDVDRCIVVTVYRQPALRTGMNPVLKCLGNFDSAARAVLRRAAGIHCNRQQPGSFSLDCQNLQELALASIVS